MARVKKIIELRSNDEVRRLVLRYFYDRNASATSKTGKKGSHVKISDVKADLKRLHGLSQQEVISNLNYLVSMGWVEEHDVQRMVPAKAGVMIPQTSHLYAITASGMEWVDGASEFTRDIFSGIKITGDFNVTTIGGGNTVNVQYADLGNALTELRDAVKASSALDQETKINALADIQTIQTQLAKPKPSFAIVRSVWAGLSGLATVDGLIGLAEKAGTFIRNLPM